MGTAAEMVDSVIQATGFYEQRIHVLGEMNKTIACRIDKAPRTWERPSDHAPVVAEFSL